MQIELDVKLFLSNTHLISVLDLPVPELLFGINS